ncbi:MAG TPA: thioredoxin domain-containing protein [Candidatus Saccharimonadales bacterium]|nr:thioredoxin domain-containing protein [Candidatus Saccharimonadales bacterium]
MSSDSKFFLWVIIAAIVVIGGIIIFSATKKNSPVNVSTTDGQKLGSDSAKVKIVEFADFECPACAQAAPDLLKAQQNNSSDVQLIYRFFPLTQIHANAMSSAMAAMAAANQNKFWDMDTLLFSNQQSWADLNDPTNAFVSYATQLGLDVNKFRSDLTNSDLRAIVQKDQDYGTSLGIDSTPTFYINDLKVVGVRTADQWQTLINTAKSQ